MDECASTNWKNNERATSSPCCLGVKGLFWVNPRLERINPLDNNPKLPAWWGWNYISYRVFSMSPLITIIFTSNAKGLLGIEP